MANYTAAKKKSCPLLPYHESGKAENVASFVIKRVAYIHNLLLSSTFISTEILPTYIGIKITLKHISPTTYFSMHGDV